MRGEAYGRELLNAADRQRGRHFSLQPSNMPVRHQCSAWQSAIALPLDGTAYSAAGCSTCGSSASSPGLDAGRHTRLNGRRLQDLYDRPVLIDRGTRRRRSARLRTIWRHALAIDDRDKREGNVIFNCPGRQYSSIGSLKARSCQTVDRMWHMVVANSLRHVAPDTERVTTGIVARSIPSFWSVTSRPRTTPPAPFTSDVRRGLLLRIMTPLANSHQLFWPVQCNSPVRGLTNSRIDSAFRSSCARCLKIRMADAGVMTSPTLLQASSK